MTHTERKDLAGSYEKRWYQSKKFIAFILMEAVYCAMAMVALFTQENLGWPLTAFMTGIVIAMGFLALAFNGKQAQLDMYVRAMALTGRMPAGLEKESTGATDTLRDYCSRCGQTRPENEEEI